MPCRNNFLIGLISLLILVTTCPVVYAERETVGLSGNWQLQPGKEMPESFGYEIPVPGLVDLANPSLSWQKEEYFWYKKTFVLNSKQKKPHAFIKIEQSQFGSEVYLNGQGLGGYIGCYTSHEYSADKAINYNGENTLLVRVGAKNTLSADSAVGHDWERVSYIPGIWGDVFLYLTDEVKIENIQVIPGIDSATALVKITLRNLGMIPQDAKAVIQIIEKNSGKKAGEVSFDFHLGANQEKIEEKEIKIDQVKLWSPETPFLYTAKVEIGQGGKTADTLSANFGMREFKIIDRHFYLNGKRIVLRGSNIAFHRFLSDPDRKNLVWDRDWIKRLLIDIPKAHNFNFFRNHLGQMYNRWYDIADEYGMLLQDEWAFWSWPTGTKEQIRQEFTQWIKDNWNHPSIIMWDSLNEATYDKSERSQMIDFVRYDLTSELKKLDPTRPWEPTDFEELHPYIYSIFPVLGSDKPEIYMDFLDRIKQSKTPVALNEYIFFWIDKNGNLSNLSKEIAPRWLGKNYTAQQCMDFQTFLGGELTELWRRMDTDEIAPFVYLSVNEGATSHWFMGDIKELQPKPILAALKNAFSPFGVSIEVWDRHFYVKEERRINVYVFNDNPQAESGILDCRIVDEAGNTAFFEKKITVSVGAGETKITAVDWKMPDTAGTYYFTAELIPQGSNVPVAVSRKIAHVFESPSSDKQLLNVNLMVYDPDNEIKDYLISKGLKVSDFNPALLGNQDMLVVGEGGLLENNYKGSIKEISAFVKSGKTLIVIEPSYNVKDRQEVEVCDEISLTIDPMPWRGNESYVFWEKPDFPLWGRIKEDHLKMFNGGFGGEIISEYDVMPPLPFKTEAICGAGLIIPAVMETYTGEGLVVISRIETRGRLLRQEEPDTDLYSRRPDPVAQQYLLNLLSVYRPGSNAVKQILSELKSWKVIVRKAEVSSVVGTNFALRVVDKDMATRWESGSSDPQWIKFDLGEIKEVCGVKIYWEAARAKEYQIQVSDNSKNWETVFYIKDNPGGVNFIKFDPPLKTRFIKMYGLKRATDWGYSIWEFEIFTDKKELPAESPMQSDKIIKPIKPVSTEASSLQGSEYAASNAVDGDTATRWSSLSSDPQWLVLNLGEPKEVGKIVLNWETAFAKSYKIQISADKENWRDIFTTDAGKGGIEEVQLKEPVRARYVRLLGLKRATEYGYSLWEFEVRSP